MSSGTESDNEALGVFTVRLTAPLNQNTDRTGDIGPLNFGTRPDHNATKDWTGPYRFDRVGLGQSTQSEICNGRKTS